MRLHTVYLPKALDIAMLSRKPINGATMTPVPSDCHTLSQLVQNNVPMYYCIDYTTLVTLY